MATHDALKRAFDTLLDNGNRLPEGTTAQRIGAHWASFLQDVADHDLDAAIRAFVLSRWSTAWPTIGAIMAHVPGYKAARRLEELDDADEVFGDVLDLVRNRGAYNHPGPGDLHEDPRRAAAIAAGIRAAGGWRVLCASGDRELMTIRHAFRAAFKSYREKAVVLGEWRPSGALESMGANGGPVSIAGILEHLELKA